MSYEICVTPIAGPTNDIVASEVAEPTVILLLSPPNDLPKSMTSVDANDTCFESGVAVTRNVLLSFEFVSDRIPVICTT